MPGSHTPVPHQFGAMIADFEQRLQALERSQQLVFTDPTGGSGDPANGHAVAVAGSLKQVAGINAFGIAVWNGARWTQVEAVPPSPWVAPTLLNSWVNTGGAGVATAGYMKDPLGIVHLKGRIKTGASNTIAFALPAGFRPGAADFYAAVIAGAATPAFAVIDASGNVAVGSGSGATADISLGGITFLAEN